MDLGEPESGCASGWSMCHQAWPGPRREWGVHLPQSLAKPGHEGGPDPCSEPWGAQAQGQSAAPLATGSRRRSRVPVEGLGVRGNVGGRGPWAEHLVQGCLSVPFKGFPSHPAAPVI